MVRIANGKAPVWRVKIAALHSGLDGGLRKSPDKYVFCANICAFRRKNKRSAQMSDSHERNESHGWLHTDPSNGKKNVVKTTEAVGAHMRAVFRSFDLSVDEEMGR